MKDIMSIIDSKQFKKLLRNRDFVFCIIAYPIALFLYIIIKIYIANANFEEAAVPYTIISIVILGFIMVISLFERIERKVTYKGQGDKLNLKRMENNWKN